MNAQVDTNILFPPARLVQGDLYKAQDKDQHGAPLVIKTGPNIGKARVNFFFAIAIRKNAGEQVWWQTPWGAKISQLGMSWWPQGQAQNPRFAWKIEDGDDTTPNQNGRKNCDREGFPGHWIVQLGSSFATKVYDSQGNPLLQEGLVKRGFWVEVLANLASNENAQNPGIYINHAAVAFRAPDKEITSGPDPRSIGFGAAPLPAGVTAAPVGTAAMPAMPAPGGMPAMPGAPGMPAPGQYPAFPGAPGAAPQMQMPGAPAMPGHVGAPAMAPTPVMPQQQFLQPPVGGAPAVPAAPGPAANFAPAPPPPAVVCPLGAPMGYRMTNLNGGRYEAFKQSGWTDPAMIQGGHMVRL
jgi:hypothetical protein